MALADVVEEAQEPSATIYSKENFGYFNERLRNLEERCTEKLMLQGFNAENIVMEDYLHMRYDGTDCALMVGPGGDYMSKFLERYQCEFGFTIPDRTIIVDDIRVRGVGKSECATENNKPALSGDAFPEKVLLIPFSFLSFTIKFISR